MDKQEACISLSDVSEWHMCQNDSCQYEWLLVYKAGKLVDKGPVVWLCELIDDGGARCELVFKYWYLRNVHFTWEYLSVLFLWHKNYLFPNTYMIPIM